MLKSKLIKTRCIINNYKRSVVKEIKKDSFKIEIRRGNKPVLDYSEKSAEVINKAASVILIRHGNSTFNKLFHELEGPGYVVHPKYFDIYSNLDIIDAPLSDLGIRQCLKASALVSKIKFGIVYISPLRRAIETAYYMFKDHPNFKNIEFIVHPLVRENIMTTSDIPDSIDNTLKNYAQRF